MNRKYLKISLLGSTLLLSACAGKPVTQYQARDISGSAEINRTVPDGALQMHYTKIPSLKDIEDLKQGKLDSLSEAKQDQRQRSLKSLALSYGARVGMAYRTQQIDQRLNQQANKLSSIYDFQPFLIQAPSGQLILPPVISSMQNAWETTDNSTTVRIADQKYKILRKSVFVQKAPIWQEYLYHSYVSPSLPQSNQLPKTNAERNIWRHYVDEGYSAGCKTADAAFQDSLRLLVRDYTGMSRYTQLIKEGKVSAPSVSEVKLGVTGDGDSSSYNDRRIGISAQPKLYAGSKVYRIGNEVSPTPANEGMTSQPLPNQDTSAPPPPPSGFNPRDVF